MPAPIVTPSNIGPADTLHLPRILCLHGGGTNARIFKSQCRALTAQLQADFRLVFVEAPFVCQETGSDVKSVYGEWGPFRRWLRWRPEQPWIPAREVVQAMDRACEQAMRNDSQLNGATGPWIALLGFSQGAKVAASMLYRQQLQDDGLSDDLIAGGPRCTFRFGILFSGRGPLVDLSDDDASTLPDASDLTTAVADLTDLPQNGCTPRLRIPTLHVHALRDPGLASHRLLYRDFCDPRSRALVQWDGDHRVPLKRSDVLMVAGKIRLLAKLTTAGDH